MKARVIVVMNGINKGSCFFVMVLNSHNDIPIIPEISDS